MLRRRILWVVLALPGLVALWILAGFAGALVPSGGEAPGDAIEIRFVGTAIHDDFLLPATPETRAAFGFTSGAGVPVNDSRVAWILVGWGARDFYTATGTYSDMSARPVWRAITGDASVLRVDVLTDYPDPAPRRLSLSAAQYSRLLTAITASTDGTPLDLAGFTPTDRFFVGRDRFNINRTCNVWVGAMLRAAGLRFGVWTPTPQATRLSIATYLR